MHRNIAQENTIFGKFIYYGITLNKKNSSDEHDLKERIKIFSGAQLKYIAFLSMLIDHTNKALIYPNLDGGALNA